MLYHCDRHGLPPSAKLGTAVASQLMVLGLKSMGQPVLYSRKVIDVCVDLTLVKMELRISTTHPITFESVKRCFKVTVITL